MSSNEHPVFDVLILGASLTGVELVWRLRRSRAGRRLRIGVVDLRTKHAYIPLIQERLTERISPSESVLDTQAYVASKPGDRFIVGEVVGMDPQTRTVTLADGTQLRGEVVVVALGSVVEPPPLLDGGPRALSLKFGDQLARVHAALDELRERDTGAPARIVVVGGGITGVELAGELAVSRGRDPKPRLEVTLVQGAERLLPHLTARAGARAAQILEDQGVDLRTKTRLQSVHDEGVLLADRTGGSVQELDMETDLVLWAGGVRPAPVLGTLGLPTTEDGWLEVGPTLQPFPGQPGALGRIFAGGDAVRIVGGTGMWRTMQRAIEAIWQAKTLARNIVTTLGVPVDDPDGPPPLRPHSTWEDFAHGISLGARSLVVWGPMVLDLGAFNVRFRRWLMRQYMNRYRP